MRLPGRRALINAPVTENGKASVSQTAPLKRSGSAVSHADKCKPSMNTTRATTSRHRLQTSQGYALSQDPPPCCVDHTCTSLSEYRR
jgi:hypothetical protein